MSREQYDLFFELLRVALGFQGRLSKTPTEEGWKLLFEISVKQSLSGICFAGIRKIVEQSQQLSEEQYMDWLDIAVQIQQENELRNKQTQKICKMLICSNFDCCVLKGQAVATLYKTSSFLGDLRQPGDIDIWILSSPQKVIDWGKMIGSIYYYDYHHADLDYFNDTEVELHYRPTLSRNLIRNLHLQEWFKKKGVDLIDKDDELGFPIPNRDFNLVLILNHIFWHLLFEGVGLRQMMDLFFVLKDYNEHAKQNNSEKTIELIKKFGLLKFAGAAMWVLQRVFYVNNKQVCKKHSWMICEPDEERGKNLLKEIMIAGNFGRYDLRIKHEKTNKVGLMLRWVTHSMRLLRDYPTDVLWTPVGILYISMWRRFHRW